MSLYYDDDDDPYINAKLYSPREEGVGQMDNRTL